MLRALKKLYTNSTAEQFDDKCLKIVDAVCNSTGEEHREFYNKYIEEMKKNIGI